jgi:hypothetical protein
MTGTVLSQAFLGFEPYVAAEEAAGFLKITPRSVKETVRGGAMEAFVLVSRCHLERNKWNCGSMM